MATHTIVSEASPRSSALPRALLVLGRVALGLVFLYAGYAKLHFAGEWHLRDYHFLFAMGVDSYRILPLWGVEWVSIILPWFEVALGALLISGIALPWVAMVTSGLMLVFITAQIYAKIQGLQINCGCFGNNEKLGTATLIHDIGFLVFALLVTMGAFLIKKRQRRFRRVHHVPAGHLR